MNGKLSVIIPVYNTGHYLYKALNSVVSQTYRNLEIIIIDDGSTDCSSDIYSEFAGKDDRIMIYKEPNLGVSFARNNGLALSTGEYIAFFDSDDWIDETAYEEMLQLLEDTGSDIVMCGYVNETENSKNKRAKYNITGTGVKPAEELLKDMFLDRIYGFTCNKIFKREVIMQDNLLFDKNLLVLEDFCFLVRVFHSRPQFAYTEKPFYHYFYRRGSLSKSDVNDQKLTMNTGSEMILEDVRLNFPNLLKQAAEFFYNTNVGLLDEVYHSKPVNSFYKETILSSIKKAGLLNQVNLKIRIKVMMIINFPGVFGMIKKFTG